MTEERQLIEGLLARIEALVSAMDEDRAGLGTVPAMIETFDAMPRDKRTASRAIMKSVEQTEDQIARIVRALPSILGIESSNWYMQDYANFMEKIGVIDDAFVWMQIVRLRNRLVHDYPVEIEAQLAKLHETIAASDVLKNVAKRIAGFVKERGLVG